MSDDRLAEKLAVRVLGLKPALGRFIKPGGGWISKSRFNPFVRVEHAFQLLDQAGGSSMVTTDAHGVISAEVRIGDRVGRASGKPRARMITLAIARALDLETLQ